MPELLALLGERLDQFGVCMPQCIHGNAPRQIDVLSTGLVKETGALATHRDDLHRGIVRHHVLVKRGSSNIAHEMKYSIKSSK